MTPSNNHNEKLEATDSNGGSRRLPHRGGELEPKICGASVEAVAQNMSVGIGALKQAQPIEGTDDKKKAKTKQGKKGGGKGKPKGKKGKGKGKKKPKGKKGKKGKKKKGKKPSATSRKSHKAKGEG